MNHNESQDSVAEHHLEAANANQDPEEEAEETDAQDEAERHLTGKPSTVKKSSKPHVLAGSSYNQPDPRIIRQGPQVPMMASG